MAKPLGDNIRQARIEKGMERAELAAKVGRSVKHISNIENGANTAKPELLYRIARVLELPIDQVMASDWIGAA
ncbi:helix-turn-helix transcriptional regulator [Amycolatopsis sp. VS8301801F10]|uniref:helix-turn-helix transcriptional regulator n=1 Tax=unclassified Amycolatopsis TaxID=2618356 RepID=UPI0038FC26E8